MARPRTTVEQERMLARIGASLRGHRETAGLTQSEFGRIAGRDDKYISRVELGHVNISATRVIEFAQALGIPPGALLDDAAAPADE